MTGPALIVDMLMAFLLQGTAQDWHVVWYTSAAVCFTAGTSFALFAGRSVSPRRSEAVTQSVELMPPSAQPTPTPLQHSSNEAVDSPRPYVPLMTQDHAPLARYVDTSSTTDNHVTRRYSQPQLLSTAESPPPIQTSPPPSQTTHSQLISIV